MVFEDNEEGNEDVDITTASPIQCLLDVDLKPEALFHLHIDGENFWRYLNFNCQEVIDIDLGLRDFRFNSVFDWITRLAVSQWQLDIDRRGKGRKAETEHRGWQHANLEVEKRLTTSSQIFTISSANSANNSFGLSAPARTWASR